MRLRGLAIVAVVAALGVGVALASWWVLGVPPTPVAAPAGAAAPREASPETPPSLAVQRLAEFVSGAAFRAVITHDYAGLTELVKRAASWSDVAYLGVEDAQGKVIAHTDPAKVGQPAATSGREPGTARPGLQEVTVAVAGPDAGGKPRALMGQVRLGYVDEARPAVAPDPPSTAPSAEPAAQLPLWMLLACAGLAALPIGLVIARLAGGASHGAPTLPADLRKIASVRQARLAIAQWMKEAEAARAELGSQRAETDRLALELAERTGDLARSESVRAAIDREAAAWVDERAQLNAEIRERATEIEDARATLHARAAEVEAAARARLLLEAELADLKDEVEAARSALAGHSPGGAREVADHELRQHQHRAIAYIARSIRGSLTSVLGFSKLLLRAGDGPLNEAQRASVANIHEAGNRLLRIVSDLSDLTQVEAGTVEVRDEIVDVGAVLREVSASAAAALGRAPETIAVQSPIDLPAIRGNKRRLVQLLLSVMQAPTPDGAASTEVAARADGDSLHLVVTHRGAVIPCGELRTLFDPFSPIDATEMLQDDGRRLRLGLARALATTLGGQLRVASLEETGTVFTVTMPVMAGVPAIA